MKANIELLDTFRLPEGPYGPMYYPASKGDHGLFEVEIGDGNWKLFIISSGSDDLTKWEHVSVSKRHKFLRQSPLPTWEDMCFVKKLFWGDDETVLQFHPKASEYVNNAPVLHLWKKKGEDFELPPSLLVGIKR